MKIQKIGVMILTIALFISGNLAAQEIFEKMILTTADLPQDYIFVEALNCKSIQAQILYDKPETYAIIIGKLASKQSQSFIGNKDIGSILFFEFEKPFEQAGFLEALLWEGRKPTKEHPETFLVKDNILIIWSTSKKSKVKSISKAKIEGVLK